MKKIKGLVFICLTTIAFMACNKKEVVTTPFTIHLTDAPGDFDKVNIDVQSVEITTSGNGAGTFVFNPTLGIFNLLELSNGFDTVLTTGTLNAETISQVRLILGSNNSVVVNGTSYPLQTPSAQQSGLKLQVHESLQPGVAYAMTLDFDANQSIVLEGNGTYSLKPVIRVISSAVSGSVSGIIMLPVGVAFNGITTVTVTNGINTYTSVADAEGNFLVQGVPAGVYTVTIHPQSPFTDVTMLNVAVGIGSVTSLGEITVN